MGDDDHYQPIEIGIPILEAVQLAADTADCATDLVIRAEFHSRFEVEHDDLAGKPGSLVRRDAHWRIDLDAEEEWLEDGRYVHPRPRHSMIVFEDRTAYHWNEATVPWSPPNDVPIRRAPATRESQQVPLPLTMESALRLAASRRGKDESHIRNAYRNSSWQIEAAMLESPENRSRIARLDGHWRIEFAGHEGLDPKDDAYRGTITELDWLHVFDDGEVLTFVELERGWREPGRGS